MPMPAMSFQVPCDKETWDGTKSCSRAEQHKVQIKIPILISSHNDWISSSRGQVDSPPPNAGLEGLKMEYIIDLRKKSTNH